MTTVTQSNWRLWAVMLYLNERNRPEASARQITINLSREGWNVFPTIGRTWREQIRAVRSTLEAECKKTYPKIRKRESCGSVFYSLTDVGKFFTDEMLVDNQNITPEESKKAGGQNEN